MPETRLLGTNRGDRALELSDELDRIYGQDVFDVIAVNMEIWFSWLGTEEDAGSGADVIEQICRVHRELLEPPDEEVCDVG